MKKQKSPLQNERVLIILLGLFLLLMAPQSIYAQEKIIVVPFSPDSLELPHPSHENAPITLKAIVRSTTCTDYYVWWDTDMDGDYDDEIRAEYAENVDVDGIRNIGMAFMTPEVSQDTILHIGVKVQNRCTNEILTDTMCIFVHDFTPDNDPQVWTENQLEVMSAMSVNETMWFLHRGMTTFSGTSPNSSDITAQAERYMVNNDQIILFINNGHLPAYPPGSINPYALTLPPNWEQENNKRWETDPYAESIMRLINRVISLSIEFAIPDDEEDNTIGYDENQNVLYGTRIIGTQDNIGIRIGGNSSPDNGFNGASGSALELISLSLQVLGNTPIQLGSQVGKPWEFVAQQIVDYIRLCSN